MGTNIVWLPVVFFFCIAEEKKSHRGLDQHKVMTDFGGTRPRSKTTLLSPIFEVSLAHSPKYML